MSKNVIGPQNPEDQKTVKFDCFIPTLSQDSVTLITSTYEEAEAWGLYLFYKRPLMKV
jgi:hypothetical protein